MKRVLLLVTSLLGSLGMLASIEATSRRPEPQTLANQRQGLTLAQIESLIAIPAPDEVIAGEIQEKGLAFKLDGLTLEGLRRRGAGPRTLKALSVYVSTASPFEERLLATIPQGFEEPRGGWSLIFSSDGNKVAYKAKQGDKEFIVIGDK